MNDELLIELLEPKKINEFEQGTLKLFPDPGDRFEFLCDIIAQIDDLGVSLIPSKESIFDSPYDHDTLLNFYKKWYGDKLEGKEISLIAKAVNKYLGEEALDFVLNGEKIRWENRVNDIFDFWGKVASHLKLLDDSARYYKEQLRPRAERMKADTALERPSVKTRTIQKPIKPIIWDGSKDVFERLCSILLKIGAIENKNEFEFHFCFDEENLSTFDSLQPIRWKSSFTNFSRFIHIIKKGGVQDQNYIPFISASYTEITSHFEFLNENYNQYLSVSSDRLKKGISSITNSATKGDKIWDKFEKELNTGKYKNQLKKLSH